MAEPFSVQIPGLAKLVAQIAALLRNDAEVRAEQANNAPQASDFDDQTATGITGATIYKITPALSGSKRYYQLVLTFNAASGSGRYRMDGPAPQPAVGIPIPSGGVVLTITGAANIQNFQMIAEAGQTLTFSRYLFI